MIGNLRVWGWITLYLGVLLLLAAAGVLAGNQLARTAAVVVLGFNAIDQMFFIPAYPFWALTIIAMDVVALYGLCAYGHRRRVRGGRSHPPPRSGGHLDPDDLQATAAAADRRLEIDRLEGKRARTPHRENNGSPAGPQEEPFQEPTETDFRRQPATP